MSIEQRVRDALSARAAAVSPKPSLGKTASNRRSVRSRASVVGVVAAALAVALVTLVTVRFHDGARERTTASLAPHSSAPLNPGLVPMGQGSGLDPYHPSYPDGYKVSGLDGAQKAVDFPILVPSVEGVDGSSLSGVYVLPTGALVLDFPALDKPSAPLRQAYIEIYETRWDPTMDPEKSYQRMVQLDDNPYESVISISGLPALVVLPHSPADLEKANAAFLRMVVNGVEIQVSGGEDLSLLKSIATSMIG